MNTVVIDARCLLTGIGTYTLNLVRGLKSLGEIQVRALTLSSHRDALDPYCDQVDVVSAPIYSVREQFQIPWAARRCDYSHCPLPLNVLGQNTCRESGRRPAATVLGYLPR